MKFSQLAVAGVMLAAVTTSAHAATLATVGAVGPIGSPGSFSLTFDAAAGPGAVGFELNGFKTLDGVNCCTDVFTLALNGTDLFVASFNLGGGGANVVYLGTLGVDYTTGAQVVNTGGLSWVQIAVMLPNLVLGSNTLTFSYAGANQGLNDEAWGLGNANTLGYGATVYGTDVPEPASWALMIGGFALTGATLRRRRAAFA